MNRTLSRHAALVSPALWPPLPLPHCSNCPRTYQGPNELQARFGRANHDPYWPEGVVNLSRHPPQIPHPRATHHAHNLHNLQPWPDTIKDRETSTPHRQSVVVRPTCSRVAERKLRERFAGSTNVRFDSKRDDRILFGE